ncbi:MAG: right-handed parallel beta-helix repeat-containing protein, partial [Chthoniobacterales bacterium]
IGTESERIALRRVSCNHNGCLGILASRIHGLVLEDCETSFNNWRGAWAGKYRGSPCGIKVMHSRDVTLLRHKALRNLATGVWIDEENRDVRVREATIYGNYRGLHIEAGGGPVVVERSTICSNRLEPLGSDFRWAFGSGIAITHMPDVTLRENFLADNDTAQIGVRDDRETRVITDGATGEKRIWRTERLALEGNTIVAGGSRNKLLHVPDEAFDSRRFLKSLHATGNAYVTSANQSGFSVGRPAQLLGFEAWQKLTGQDGDSTHEQS